MFARVYCIDDYSRTILLTTGTIPDNSPYIVKRSISAY